MIVDDAYLIQQRVRAMLEGHELLTEIISAYTYVEALTILGTRPVSIALLDINLPDTNGIELLRYIKKNHPSIPVIMLSNQSGEFYRSRCKTLGASHFIDKSTEFESLLSVIDSFL